MSTVKCLGGFLLLLCGVSLLMAADVKPQKAKAQKVAFRIGASNSSNAPMYISCGSEDDSVQYVVKPKSSKTFNFKLTKKDNDHYQVVVSVYVGANVQRMDSFNFFHWRGKAPGDPHDRYFDFSGSQLDVAEWADGFVWSINPIHK